MIVRVATSKFCDHASLADHKEIARDCLTVAVSNLQHTQCILCLK